MTNQNQHQELREVIVKPSRHALGQPSRHAPGLALTLVTSLALAAGCAETAGTVRPGAPQTLAEVPTVEIAHERQGAPLPPLPEAARTQTVRVSYRVCAEPASGRVREVKPILGDAAADPILVPALQAAVFKLKSADEVVCFLENLALAPDGGTWQAQAQPYLPAGPEHESQPGEAQPQIPEEAQRRLVGPAGRSVVGLFKLCVPAAGGTPESVTSVVSVPGGDDAITAALRTWRYRGGPARACWIEPLLFNLTTGSPPESDPPAGTPGAPGRQDNQELSKQPRPTYLR